MRCPKHPDVWLYENLTFTVGYCRKCQEWYVLDDVKDDGIPCR